jgi:hypothetical protein
VTQITFTACPMALARRTRRDRLAAMTSTCRARLAGALFVAATIAAVPASAHANTAEMIVVARSADGALV